MPGDGPDFDERLTLDLSSVEPSVAGPRRPQDRVPLQSLRENFRSNYPDGLEAPAEPETEVEEASGDSFPASDAPAFASADAGSEPAPPAEPVVADAAPVDRRAYRPIEIEVGGERTTIGTGSVGIAAITSCTNTSNPTVMVGAGLLARNAVARGLRVGPTVKTSLAPGSKAVTGYLEKAGLMAPLEALGFALAGYGCTTCIGNSGPLDTAVAGAIEANDLVVAAVLSGNRNFEGRIHPLARASYLASPPLVVAFALAGRVDIDLTTQPLGTGSDGRPVYLADIWPSPDEIRSVIADVDRCRAVPADVRGRLRGRRALAGAADPRRAAVRLGRGLDLRREAAVPRPTSRTRGRPSRTSRAPACSPSSATPSPPTTSPRPARSRPRRPPASGSRRTASARSSSTPTARGAASTR